MKLIVYLLLIPSSLLSQKLDTLDFGKGDFIVGNMVNSEINGKGIEFVKWVKIYEGDFFSNTYHGFGKYYINGKLSLEGKWQSGVFKEGKMYSGDGRIDNGVFDDKLYMLSGSTSYSDGSHYKGQIKKNKRHGNGTLFLPDETQVETTWKKGKPYGNAVLIYPDSTRITGKWTKNEINETYIVVLIDGEEQTAKSADGESISMIR